MENFLIVGIGIFIFGASALYFWLLVKKVNKFAQYHSSLRTRNMSKLLAYVFFLLSLVGLFASFIKFIF